MSQGPMIDGQLGLGAVESQQQEEQQRREQETETRQRMRRVESEQQRQVPAPSTPMPRLGQEPEPRVPPQPAMETRAQRQAQLSAFDAFTHATGAPQMRGSSMPVADFQAGGLDDVGQFMRAIGAIESGGGNPNNIDYHIEGPRITNPNSQYYGERAYGAYQIMPGNWPSWSAEAGIPGADIRDPRAQDHVARYKMQQLYRQYGRWDAVAVAWFSGQSRADQYVQNVNLAHVTDAQAGFSGTSVPGYVRKVMSVMGGAAAERSAVPADESPWQPEQIDLAASHIGSAFNMMSVNRSGNHITFNAGSEDDARELLGWAAEQQREAGPFAHLHRSGSSVTMMWQQAPGMLRFPDGHFETPRDHRRTPLQNIVRSVAGNVPNMFAGLRRQLYGDPQTRRRIE